MAIELLESRHAPSAGSVVAALVASEAGGSADAASSSGIAAIIAEAGPADAAVLGSSWVPSSRMFVASVASALSATDRWDWLAGTQWYVPSENLLAYSTDSDLSDPQPIADQTLWNIEQSDGGIISGDALVKLSSDPVPTQTTFSGVVTDGGQIRMSFDSGVRTIGIGQMRFVDGQWRVEMQMATGVNTLVTHWAYMSELPEAATPPEAIDPPPDPSLLSDEWRWLEGTHWALVDTDLFGSAGAGAFEIDSFRNGYFWGSGTSDQPFNVLGSVTPEGNVLLLVALDGGDPESRTGILQQTSSGGVMTLRTYAGTPAVGWAWTLPAV